MGANQIATAPFPADYAHVVGNSSVFSTSAVQAELKNTMQRSLIQPLGGYRTSTQKVGDFYSSGKVVVPTSGSYRFDNTQGTPNTLRQQDVFVSKHDPSALKLPKVTSFPTVPTSTYYLSEYVPIETSYWSSVPGSTA